jgi:Kef-type K+ transport system membrane component KefB
MNSFMTLSFSVIAACFDWSQTPAFFFGVICNIIKSSTAVVKVVSQIKQHHHQVNQVSVHVSVYLYAMKGVG